MNSITFKVLLVFIFLATTIITRDKGSVSAFDESNQKQTKDRDFFLWDREGKSLDEDEDSTPPTTPRGYFDDHHNHKGDADEEDEDEMENVMHQLENVRCPARHVGIIDYWNCLWRSSVTSEGLYKEMLDLYLGDPDNESWTLEEESEIDEPKVRVKVESKMGVNMTKPGRNDTGGSGTSESKKRVKRQGRPKAPNIPVFDYGSNATADILKSLGNIYVVRKCQVQTIEPGSSLANFFTCLRDDRNSPRTMAKTLKATYEDYKNEWNTREFDNSFTSPIKCIDQSVQKEGCFIKHIYQFDPLFDEDVYPHFAGADPYIDGQLSSFIYKQNNLISTQRQPGWSYNGLDAANQWHNLNLLKFFVPLKESVDLAKMALQPEFAQTYPGTGKIVEAFGSGVKEAKDIGNLWAPLDYNWNKDSGFHAYTRYVIPLLDDADIQYYTYKEIITKAVQPAQDLKVVEDIRNKLEKFRDRILEPLVTIFKPPPKANPKIPFPPFIFFNFSAKFPTEEDIPFVEVYRDFFHHYFDVDIGIYKSEKTMAKKFFNSPYVPVFPSEFLHPEFDVIRLVILHYLDAVVEQLNCLVVILKDSEKRKDKEDVNEYLFTKVANFSNCTVHGLYDAMHPPRPPPKTPPRPYVVANTTLIKIYNSYFERKDARQRYSLPVYPLKFPICRHNEPSPIDIVTKAGRKSSLHSYSFSEHAYHLKHFFIMFPNDGSHLLSVGIVNGERLDESSVVLKGGAVKGQTLSFQYMYIRFGKDWKSEGSEHRINGKAGQMELQMIFTIAGGSADRMKYWHILARVQNQMFQAREKLVIILSVLVDVLETHRMLVEKIAKEGTNQDPYLFEPFAHAAYLFRSHQRKLPLKDHPRGYVSKDPTFRLVEFLPNVTGKFYTYRGSLSWPPCFGYVLWSVFEKRLYMSKRQFDEFAKMPGFGTSDFNRIADNFRRPKDIFVEEESMVRDYAKKQDMLYKRTVNRFILEGLHDPTPELHSSNAGVVDEDMYYLTAEDFENSAPKSNGLGKELFLTLPLLKSKDYLFKG